MKAIITTLVFFSIFTFTQVFGQSYEPFIFPDKHWNVVHTDLTGGSPKWATTYEYWITETDTIINDTTYKVVYAQGDWLAEEGIIGFIREDVVDRKVFFRSLHNAYPHDKDQLLYDFSVEAGEIVNVYGLLSCAWQYEQIPYLVTSTGDTTLLNGEVKKTWYLNAVNGYSEPDIWIEDIGSLNGVLFPGCYMFATTSMSRDLLCYFKNGENLYISELDTCFVDWTTDVKLTNVPQPKIYPNPVSGNFLNIEVPDSYEKLHHVEILDMMGNSVLKMEQFENGLDIHFLTQGLYFIRFLSGNNSFQYKFVKL